MPGGPKISGQEAKNMYLLWIGDHRSALPCSAAVHVRFDMCKTHIKAKKKDR